MLPAIVEKAEKASCMDIRLTDLQRTKYEKAAALKGQTLTQWASFYLDACANRDIAEAAVTTLSGTTFDCFCAILDSPIPVATRELLEREPAWR